MHPVPQPFLAAALLLGTAGWLLLAQRDAPPDPDGTPTVVVPHGPRAARTAGPSIPRLPAPDAHAIDDEAGGLFRTSDLCMGCHNGVSTSTGEDVSIGSAWRASMMANSARDPYWQATVRREITDHPTARAAIEDKCATCHMPMARYQAHTAGRAGEVFANLPIAGPGAVQAPFAADGVSCSTCHQILSDNLGTEESFSGGFRVQETGAVRPMFGPFETDAGRTTIMRSATGFTPTRGAHIQSSELCASCHTLYTHALDGAGLEVGKLPEQVPYLEWRESEFAAEGGRTCQSCHMPVVREPVPVTKVLGQPRDSVSRHVFRGGNFFVLGMLNRYRDELGVTALPQELDASVRRTLEHLESSTARMWVSDPTLEEGRLVFDVGVENLAGHKLPTAYPSRRAWLHVTVYDREGTPVFESGALRPDGSVVGNDNDRDARAYEPHYRVVERPDQVQIWEAIMVDPDGEVTTGLLEAVEYAKDNRLLPRGFRKGDVHEDVRVRGDAADDEDFAGGTDQVRYAVEVGPATAGPYRVEAELWYQPIGFRWAMNLADYRGFEPERFVRYYRSMAPASGTVVTRAMATQPSASDAGRAGSDR